MEFRSTRLKSNYKLLATPNRKSYTSWTLWKMIWTWPMMTYELIQLQQTQGVLSASHIMQTSMIVRDQLETAYASPPRQCNTGTPAGPLNNFDKIFCRWWKLIKKSVLLSKILTLWYRNVGLSSWKFQIFGKNLSIRDKSPGAIPTRLGTGRVFQVRSLTPNITVVA